MLTKGAIGNLINRYRAVLKKCNLINAFGSLAVASMLVLGGAGVAGADTFSISGDMDRLSLVQDTATSTGDATFNEKSSPTFFPNINF